MTTNSTGTDESASIDDAKPVQNTNAKSVKTKAKSKLKITTAAIPGSNKWNLERRLEFIDYRLCWAGHINRSDLVKFFGISIPQSSLDLSHYCEMAKDNLKYDRHSKIYRRSSKFKPVYDICAPESYLNDVLLNTRGILSPTRNYLEKSVSVACFMPPHRKISFDVLFNIVDCIQNSLSIEITYQSMSQDEPQKHKIAPHAFGYDGIRWHVRAFDYEHDDFRDFVLSRIIDIGKKEDSNIDPNEDMKWNFVVTLIIIPNPDLSECQKNAIKMDYGMENNELKIKCRQALLFYTLRLLRLSPEDEKENEAPKKNQIVLKNKTEIYAYLNM